MKELIADILGLVRVFHYTKEETDTSETITNKISTAITNLSNSIDSKLNLKSNINHKHTKTDISDLKNASSTNAGLLSSDDKNKLDGIEAQANKVTVDFDFSSESTNPVANRVIKNGMYTKDEIHELMAHIDVGHGKLLSINVTEDGILQVDNDSFEYYTTDEVDAELAKKTVSFEQQANPDSGDFATYVLKQNNVQVGPKIKIPQDFLIRSGSVKTCTVANNPVQGYKVGDKYLDLVINTKEGSSTNNHVYILGTDFIDDYYADNITLQLVNRVFSIKDKGVSKSKLSDEVQISLDYADTFNNSPCKDITDNNIINWNNKAEISDIPTKVSELTNDRGYLTNHQDISMKVDKVSGKGLSTEDFTSAEKTKLGGIEAGANKTTIDSSMSTSSTNPVQNKVINAALGNKVDKVSGKGLSTEDFTSAEKTKLGGIEAGANKTTIDSSMSTSSTNPVQNKVINAALGNKVDKVSGKGLSTEDFTSPEKTKLAGIEAGANKTTIDSSMSTSSTNPVQNKVVKDYIDDSVGDIISGDIDLSSTHNHDDRYFTESEINTKLNTLANSKSKVSITPTKTSGTEIATITIDGTPTKLYQQDENTTYSNATTSKDGLMSSSDKTKLDGIATGANKTVLNNTVNSTSTTEAATANAVKTAYDKANHSHPYSSSSHNHTTHNTQSIASGSDLNTITTAGWYNNNSNSDVQKMSNTPWQATAPSSGGVGHAFAMEVLYTYGCIQILYPYDSNDIWVRRNNSNALGANNWTGWTKVFNKANLTKADITALGIPGTDTNTTYSKGNGLLLSGTTFSADFGTGTNQVARGDHTHKNLVKTEITSGSLDTVTTTGWYSYSTTNSNSITNVPEKTGSVMEVLDDYGNGSYVIQKVYPIRSDKNQIIYYRVKFDTMGWSSWRRIDGGDKANSSHTHPDTQITWNGTNTQNSVSPLDMAMYEEFSANRFAYFPGNNITIEYSTDGGSTWTTDTSTSTTEKLKLVTTSSNFRCGNNSTTNYAKNQLRVTIKLGETNANSIVYMDTRKLMLYLCTCGASGTKVQISTSTYKAPTTFTNQGNAMDVQGYSGWNSIPLAITLGGYAGDQTNTSSTRVQYLRLTFTQTGGTGNLNLQKIRIFGEKYWNAPSTLARMGHLYGYDENQIATFPSNIVASKFIKNGVNNTNLLTANGGDVAQSTFATSGHTHTKSQITDFPTSMTPTAHTDSNGAYGKATTSVWGHTKLSSATNSTDETMSATPKAVKTAYDLANGKSTVSVKQTKTSGIEIGSVTVNGTETKLYQQDNNTTYTAESTASNIKMNGTQSVGSLATYARGDHVHPSDTSKISTSAIKNDLTTGGATNVLSAEQGKNLQNNKLNKVQDTLAEGTDLNTIVNAGWYKNNSNVQVQKMSNTPWQTAPPSSGTGTGWAFALFVLKSYGTIQFLFPYNSTSYQSASKYKAYYRVNYNNDASNAWTQWFTLLDTELITKLNGIATGANNYSHPNSGVTAGTNYNGNQTPSFGGTFNIPKLTFNAQGHITASANSTVTVPSLPTASTSTAGILKIGTTANDACAGNDSRLSNARTPTAHNQASSTITDSTTYSNIGNSAQNQGSINSAINTKLGNAVYKSSTSGLLKNDGSVMTSGTGASNFASGDHSHGRTLVKQYGSSDEAKEVLLYAIPAIRMCFVYFKDVFSSLSANNNHTVASEGWIPDGYRPIRIAYGGGNYNSGFFATTSGALVFRAGVNISQKEVFASVYWLY